MKMRTWMLWMLGAGLVLPAVAGPGWSEADAGAEALEGTYTLDRQSSEDVIVEGALTWQYVGQIRFPERHDPPTQVSFIEQDDRPQPLAERLIGSMRYMNDGEAWRLVAVDESMLNDALVRAADEQVQRWRPDPETMVGQEVSWTPYSWTKKDCDSNPDKEVRVWNGESRTKKTAPWTDRQATTLFLESPGSSGCTATLLLERWAITAAHCVAQSNGFPHSPINSYTVHNVHSSDWSRGLDSITVASSYFASPTDFGDDWAILELSSGFSTNMPDMDLWDGTDSKFENIGAKVHNLGYPGDVLTSSGSCSSNVDGTNAWGLGLRHHANAEVTSTPTKKVRLKGDGSPGNSGGPWYFCPASADDVCGPGEKGEIVAIAAGYNTVNARHVGPKASNFRPEALTFINP
ncbi:MAG: serine protease [Myxococcota bacterium]